MLEYEKTRKQLMEHVSEIEKHYREFIELAENECFYPTEMEDEINEFENNMQYIFMRIVNGLK